MELHENIERGRLYGLPLPPTFELLAIVSCVIPNVALDGVGRRLRIQAHCEPPPTPPNGAAKHWTGPQAILASNVLIFFS